MLVCCHRSLCTDAVVPPYHTLPYSDVLIFATGYTRDYSIFDGATANRLMATGSGLHLYRSIVSPHVPGLYFIGSEVRQCRVVRQLFARGHGLL